jgi:transcriptional regulator with XRE-family HTH domain
MRLYREEASTGSLRSGATLAREGSRWAPTPEPTATDGLATSPVAIERLLQMVALGGALTSLTPGLSLRLLDGLRFAPLSTSTTCDIQFSPSSAAYEVSSANLPADMLAAIRAFLSLTVVETAQVLGVERPTVYAWLAGRAEPQARNRERLQQVFRVAKSWSRISDRPLGSAVRHEDDAGSSVLSLLREGRHEEATALLPTLVQRDLPRRVPSLRVVLTRHGLLDRIKPSMDEIDRITGKRLGPE